MKNKSGLTIMLLIISEHFQTHVALSRSSAWKIILKQIAMNGAGLKFFYILFLQYELCSKLLGYARCSSSYVSACF